MRSKNLLSVSESDSVKKRNPFLAALLSFVVPGLGQVYNVQPEKGLAFYLVALLLPFLLFCTPLVLFPEGTLGVLLLIIGFNIFVIVEAGVAAFRKSSAKLRRFKPLVRLRRALRSGLGNIFGR